MKLTTSKQAKYAEAIDSARFCKLSSRRQHEYLAHLALNAVKTGDFQGFFTRYQQMHSWVDLDKYKSPHWLSDEEAVYEYFMFHNGFSNNPVEFNSNDSLKSPESGISWKPAFEVTVVLDQVRSPYNAGSVLRLIDNFGLGRMVHNSSWLRMDHPQLRKAARGCEKWIPVEYKEDLVKWLDSVKSPVIGLEKTEDSMSVDQWQPVQECVIILGNEEYGIAGELRKYCDILIHIPMFGYKQSMNLHNALAVVAHRIASVIQE